MVEKMMGEVDRRSQKDGSRVQVVLKCRDKGATKPSFEKLCGNLSFSLFTKGIASSSLRWSGDRPEPHLNQRVKVVPPLTVNSLQVVLKKVPLFY